MSFDVDGDWHDNRLPVWQTVRQSYTGYFLNFPDVLRATLPWLVIGPVAVTGATWVQLAWMIEAIKEAQQSGASKLPAMPVTMMLLPHLGYLVLSIGLGSIAVAWHRCVIIGERPTPTDVHVVTGRFWRYVGIYLAILLMCMAMVVSVAIPIFIGVSAFGRELPWALKAVSMLFIIAAFAMAFTAMCRLSPLLPARAIDDNTLTLRETWRRTRGNTLRLFFGMLVCSVLPILPVYFVMGVLIGIFGTDSEDAFRHLIAFSAVSTLLYILIFPIFIGFLSHAYRHLFEEA